MSTTRTTIVLLATALSASLAIAGTVAVPETPGNERAQAVAEAIHNARQHGTSNLARQPIAEAPGDAQAQAAAEAIHLPKQHGNVNDSADRRMLEEAARF